jgi:hypothetical protein
LEKNAEHAANILGGAPLYIREYVQGAPICGDFSRFLVCRGRENGSEDEMAVEQSFEPELPFRRKISRSEKEGE